MDIRRRLTDLEQQAVPGPARPDTVDLLHGMFTDGRLRMDGGLVVGANHAHHERIAELLNRAIERRDNGH
jgi:hypothetical protein